MGNAARKETWKHKDVLETYFMMGPSRTIKELSSCTGLDAGTLRSWSNAFNWSEKLEARDSEAQAIVKNLNSKIYIEQVKARHTQAYQKIQLKSLKKIEKRALAFRDDKDAAIALDIGIKGERKILGLDNTTAKLGLVKEGFAAMMEVCFGAD